MRQTIVLICILMLCIIGVAEEPKESESLLGKPVTVLLPDSLEDYQIKISQPKSRSMLSEADIRHAILHSQLIDPTLPRVRHNHWPIGAEVQLKSAKQPAAPIIHIRLAGLGLLTDKPVTYVFEYTIPKRKDSQQQDAPNSVKMTGVYIWKNALEATLTPVKDKTNTWEVLFVATDHGMTSRYKGTVVVDMDGGAASGTAGFAGGHRGHTVAWTLEGTMLDGMLQCTVDEVDGTEDCAAIELAIVKQHATKEGGAASVKMKGHYVFGKNNVVKATFTAVGGEQHTWDAVFVAVYENIKWTYKGTVLADMDGGNVSGELAKEGGGAPWAIQGDIKDGVLKCACEDTSGKESSATIELKVVKRKEQ